MKFNKELIKTKLKKFVGIKTEEEINENKTPKEKFIDFVKSFGSALLAALVIITFVVQNTRIPTPSMDETIKVGDFVLVNKFIFGSSSPKYIPFTQVALPSFTLPSVREPRHGDIVVFEFPGNRDNLKADEVNVNYVKRCICLPGDTIEIKNKVVFVNGKQAWIPPHIQYDPSCLPKGISTPDIFPSGKTWNKDNFGPLVVPKKGDVIPLTKFNIEEWRTIIDREHGAIVVNDDGGKITINGVAVSSYTMKKDYFFMMGDNRDNSFDSRFWGFVPRDMIVGEAFMTLFSWDNTIPFSQPIDLLLSIRPERILKLLH